MLVFSEINFVNGYIVRIYVINNSIKMSSELN